MSQELFRKEVLEARRAGWLGGVLLAQPVRLWILTAAAASTASGNDALSVIRQGLRVRSDSLVALGRS